MRVLVLTFPENRRRMSFKSMAYLIHYRRRPAGRKTAFTEPFPFWLYQPDKPGPLPLICLTPLLGRFLFLEDLYFERRHARFFAQHGFAAVLIDRPIFQFDPARGLDQIQSYLEESVTRNRKVLDVLVERRDIQANAVGSFGISFGGVTNCLWAGQDSRLKANVFGLAGGNIPEIMLTSRDPLMRDYVKSILTSTALGKKDLGEALKKAIRLDPLNAASSIPKENVLMFLALFDRVIELRFGLRLRQALGKPKTLFLPLGHYTTLLAMPFLKWKALEFFKEKLGRPFSGG